jgi:hypothetical protein
MVSMLSLFGINSIETCCIFVEYSKTFFICYLIIHHFILFMGASHCVCMRACEGAWRSACLITCVV